MSRVDASPAAILEAHGKRRIAAFLVAPPETETARVFWDLIYDGHPLIEHATAVAVETELLATGKRVRDVLAGWRPRALVSG